MNSHTPSAQSTRPTRSFHVVIKPVGSRCNLNCTYCYYLHKEDLLGDTTRGRMADDLLEELIRQYIAAQDVDRVLFNWHGGEPALLGLDFFRKVVDLERKYAGTKRIESDFQTNGVLLDESWCEFLCKRCSHKFACNGECPKNRLIKTPDGQPGLNYLCSGIKRFLTYADPYLRQIVARLHGSGTVTTGDSSTSNV